MNNINPSSFQVICREFFTELLPFGHGFEDLKGNFTEGIKPGNTKDNKSSNKSHFEDIGDICEEFFTELRPFGHGFEDLIEDFTEGINPGNTKDIKSSNKMHFEDIRDICKEFFTELRPFGHGFEDLIEHFTEGDGKKSIGDYFGDFKKFITEFVKAETTKEEDFEEFLKELIQRLQSEKILNEKKSVEKVKFPTNLESDGDIAEMNNDVGLFTEEKSKNTVQSEKPQIGKNLSPIEEFWAELDENSKTPQSGDGNEKENNAEELFQVVQLENNTAEIVTNVSAWLD